MAAFENAQYRDALDRATVARLGVMVTLAESWSGRGAAGDREIVAKCRPPDWNPGVWSFVVVDRADRLRRTESFRLDLHAVTGALEDACELSFDEVLGLRS